tara:strand:+ start:594 stop:869 length:276 start_codon:yes stop_codon:yes gene_type:complete
MTHLKTYWTNLVNGNVAGHNKKGSFWAVIHILKGIVPIITFLISFFCALAITFDHSISQESRLIVSAYFGASALFSIILFRKWNLTLNRNK